MILQFDDMTSLSGARLRDPEYLTLIFGTLHEIELDCKAGASMDPADLESAGCVRWEAVLVPNQAGEKELWSSEDITVSGARVSFSAQLLSSVCFAYIEGRARTDALLLVRGYTNELQSSLRVTIQLPVVLMSNPMAKPMFDAPAAIAARNEAVLAAEEARKLVDDISIDITTVADNADAAKQSAEAAGASAALALNTVHDVTYYATIAKQAARSAEASAGQATLEATNTASSAKAVAEYLSLASEIRDQILEATDKAKESADAAELAGNTATERADELAETLNVAQSLLVDAQTALEETEARLESAEAAADEAETAKAGCQEILTQMGELKASVLSVVSIPVGHAYNVGVTERDNVVYISFTDPQDTVTDQGAVLAFWERTRLIVKTGGFPENELDGTIIVDNLDRNKYRDTPYSAVMGDASNYYFALFTCTTGGVWNVDDKAPRFQISYAGFGTIRQMIRTGVPLSNVGLELGGVVNLKTSDRFPGLRWRLADAAYKGCGFDDESVKSGAVFIPQYALCEGDTSTAALVPFDAKEAEYAATDDSVFISGKTYYRLYESMYSPMTENTDWTAGESVADWQAANLDIVYSRNYASRVSNGSGCWEESNLRQWLNAEGSGYFVRKNVYDVQSPSASFATGFMSALDADFRELIMPVYNTTMKPETPGVAEGGYGGGQSRTKDYVWIPSQRELFGSGPQEGMQFALFADGESLVVYDENGYPRPMHLRTAGDDAGAVKGLDALGGLDGAGHPCVEAACFPVICIA